MGMHHTFLQVRLHYIDGYVQDVGSNFSINLIDLLVLNRRRLQIIELVSSVS